MSDQGESTTEVMERLLASAEAGGQFYVLRLYVTGLSPRSTTALANLRAICEQHLRGRYELEVIDLYQHPEAATADQIVAVPTLVKALPEPLRRIIGDLSDTERVLSGLSLHLRSTAIDPAPVDPAPMAPPEVESGETVDDG